MKKQIVISAAIILVIFAVIEKDYRNKMESIWMSSKETTTTHSQVFYPLSVSDARQSSYTLPDNSWNNFLSPD